MMPNHYLDYALDLLSCQGIRHGSLTKENPCRLFPRIPTIMSDLQALLFDVDGTLADTERDGHRVGFNLAFQEAGLDWDWTVELYGSLLSVAGGKERILHFLSTELPGFEPPEDLNTFIAKLHKAKTRHYTQLLAEGRIPLRPGVNRLIQEAREAGIRLAIVTTTTPANVTALLENTLGKDSLSWFELIAAGDVVPAKKPAPDIYVYTLETMKLQANQCLAFEDSYNGVISSSTIGIPTVITVNDYTRDHDFSGATLVLDQLGDPDQPFQSLSGDPGSATYFDLALAQQIHQQSL